MHTTRAPRAQITPALVCLLFAFMLLSFPKTHPPSPSLLDSPCAGAWGSRCGSLSEHNYNPAPTAGCLCGCLEGQSETREKDCGLCLQMGVSWYRQVRVAGPKNRRGTILRLAEIIQSPKSKIEQSKCRLSFCCLLCRSGEDRKQTIRKLL